LYCEDPYDQYDPVEICGGSGTILSVCSAGHLKLLQRIMKKYRKFAERQTK
ncbi:Hypothetical protein FKW44_013987, partial [Caligus rogercresseyi]